MGVQEINVGVSGLVVWHIFSFSICELCCDVLSKKTKKEKESDKENCF
jgi:hypothetical protein